MYTSSSPFEPEMIGSLSRRDPEAFRLADRIVKRHEGIEAGDEGAALNARARDVRDHVKSLFYTDGKTADDLKHDISQIYPDLTGEVVERVYKMFLAIRRLQKN